ncbi:hypothetical protein DSL72_003486 [Monilinia vaccinii-corymbosi]|uniref:Uncharacterized protein n=1 Tax=Monilinia vaccinii-corymbosi TaxID=61207 RepID=A0A8A3P919_9HELO|nr:hypothetical protein DSL72_003486 [Monilinia vaccinii-corymbosi]
MSGQEPAGNKETPPTYRIKHLTNSPADQQQAMPATDAEASSHPQHTEDDRMMDTPESPSDIYTNNHSFSDTPVKSPSKTPVTQDKVNHGAPGSSWSSKKYREEYDRAWDGLVDQNWDGKTKYGDPLMKK